MPKRVISARDDYEEAPHATAVRADVNTDLLDDQSPKRVQPCDDDDSSDAASDCSSSDYDHDNDVTDVCHNCEIEMAACDLEEFHTTDGDTWLLCTDCAVCFICGEPLNSDRPGCSSKDDQNFIVVDHNGRKGQRRRFACSSMWMDEEVIGCGERCATCGIVSAYEIPILNDTDGELCDCLRHDHECVVCGDVRPGAELLQLYDGGLACPDKCAVPCKECLSAHDVNSDCATERGKYRRRRGDVNPGEFRVSVFKLRQELREKLADVADVLNAVSSPSASPVNTCDSCQQSVSRRNGPYQDQDGREWALCDTCAVCGVCKQRLGTGVRGQSTNETLYVATEEWQGCRTFMCSTALFDADAIGCGAYCDECGLVSAERLVYCSLACGNNLCVIHRHDRCDKCPRDVTAAIDIRAMEVLSERSDPVQFGLPQGRRVLLSDVQGTESLPDDRYALLRFKQLNRAPLGITQITAERLMSAVRQRRFMGL